MDKWVIKLSDDELKIVSSDELLRMEKTAEEFDGIYGWVVVGKLNEFNINEIIPDIETVKQASQKYANEKGGGEYGFAFRCYINGVDWAINYIQKRIKPN